MTKHLADLTPNPRNPRKITDEKKAMLKKSLGEFGDLSGVVYNRVSTQLVGGHQRTDAFKEANPAIVIEREYNPPTKVGTVAEGYFEIEGERYRYREVIWDAKKEMAANLAANKGAGEWNYTLLTEDMLALDDGSFDMDLTMFDETERERLCVGWDSDIEKATNTVEFGEASKATIKITCPEELKNEVLIYIKAKLLETSFAGVHVE